MFEPSRKGSPAPNANGHDAPGAPAVLSSLSWYGRVARGDRHDLRRVMDAGGGTPEVLTRSRGNKIMVDWSPDGRPFVLAADRRGNLDLFRRRRGRFRDVAHARPRRQVRPCLDAGWMLHHVRASRRRRIRGRLRDTPRREGRVQNRTRSCPRLVARRVDACECYAIRNRSRDPRRSNETADEGFARLGADVVARRFAARVPTRPGAPRRKPLRHQC